VITNRYVELTALGFVCSIDAEIESP